MSAGRVFADRDFEHLGTIELERGDDGEIRTFMPQAHYSRRVFGGASCLWCRTVLPVSDRPKAQ